MAVDVFVTETSLNGTTSTRTNHPVTPRRRLAPNDGRASTSNASSPSRMRRNNVDFGLSNSVSLPPSAAGSSGIDFQRVENRFNAIASSIDNLGMSHITRHSEVIYDAIIKSMKDKNDAERNGCSEDLVQIYQEKIDRLIREKDNANILQDQYYETVIRNRLEEGGADDNTPSSITMNDA